MSEDARFTLILGAAVVIRENAKKTTTTGKSGLRSSPGVGKYA